jgi:biopolymer transport protein TolR
MWGFVSIMLALLFMFLPITPDAPRLVSVDLPPAYHSTSMPGALREDAMQISVTRDGKVYFRNDQIMLQNLPEEILKGVQNGAEKRIYLQVDARAKYGDAIAVLAQIRLAGIERVSVLTGQASQ